MTAVSFRVPKTAELVADRLRRQIVSGVEIDSAVPTTDHAFDRGMRAHRRPVSHIAVGDVERAEALWRKHLKEANEFLLDIPGPMTILDLLN